MFSDSAEVEYCKGMWKTLLAIMNDVGFTEEVSHAMLLIIVLCFQYCSDTKHSVTASALQLISQTSLTSCCSN